MAKKNNNDRGPAGNTAPKKSPVSIPSNKQLSGGGGGGGVKAQVKAAGSILSKNEALKIAESTGKAVAQVMAKAQGNGTALGASLVNQFNKGSLGVNTSALREPIPGYTTAVNQSQGVISALQQLQNLNGLQMQQGTAYYGTTTTPTGAVPIVMPRSVVSGVQPAAAPAATDQNNQNNQNNQPGVKSWENSVENSNQALIDSINKQIAANSEQAQLYMGQINDLMASMQQANQNGGLQQITPYATTTSVAPANGAQMTQAITARKKPVNTDLSISSLVGDLAGTGLNIAI